MQQFVHMSVVCQSEVSIFVCLDVCVWSLGCMCDRLDVCMVALMSLLSLGCLRGCSLLLQ